MKSKFLIEGACLNVHEKRKHKKEGPGCRTVCSKKFSWGEGRWEVDGGDGGCGDGSDCESRDEEMDETRGLGLESIRLILFYDRFYCYWEC